MAWLQRFGFMRLLRAALAVLFLVDALRGGGVVAWILAALLGAQAWFNVGCCGTACAAPAMNRNSGTDVQEVEFEEVKAP